MQPNATVSHVASESPRRLPRDLAIVVAASLVVTVPFCNKAFHIDDTLYLHIARQILVDPWRPFDAPINWQHVTEPAWNVSISPPGYSYWLAAWMAAGVRGEVGLHLAGSVWTVLLGVATYAWARRLGEWPVTAALLVVTGPIVVAGQNLMLDVPMLALATSSVVLYRHADEHGSARWAILAGAVAGLAVNVKYAGVVAILVMAVDAVLWRRWALLVAPATGGLFLGAGQLAAAIAYGTPQLAHATAWLEQLFPVGATEVLHRASESLIYIGAAAAWLVLLAGRLFRRSWTAAVLAPVGAAGAAATIIDLRLADPAAASRSFVVAAAHAGVFAFSGWVAIASLVMGAWPILHGGAGRRGAQAPSCLPSRRDMLALGVWTFGFWYLGTINGPFVAPRGILPCVVGLVLGLLAVSRSGGCPGRTTRLTAVAVTAVIGLGVGFGDYQWAAVYRDWAPRLAKEHRHEGSSTYFLGHWGWQHYAQAAGLLPYDWSRTVLKPGDLLIVPANVDQQIVLRSVLERCSEVGVEEVRASGWLPRTRSRAGLIFLHGDTLGGRIPWGWPGSDEPLEKFVILRYDG